MDEPNVSVQFTNVIFPLFPSPVSVKKGFFLSSPSFANSSRNANARSIMSLSATLISISASSSAGINIVELQISTLFPIFITLRVP